MTSKPPPTEAGRAPAEADPPLDEAGAFGVIFRAIAEFELKRMKAEVRPEPPPSSTAPLEGRRAREVRRRFRRSFSRAERRLLLGDDG